MDSLPGKSTFSQLRHDLANPLASILAEAQLLLLENTDLDPEVRRAVQTIEEMALRMRGVIMEGWPTRTDGGTASG